MADILVADDEEIVRQLLRKILEREGHTVTEASDGYQVIDILNIRQIDLLVLDLRMPGRGGIETLMELRPSHSDLKVILITGVVDTKRDFFINLFNRLGIKYVLEKPFDVKHFLKIVEESLRN